MTHLRRLAVFTLVLTALSGGANVPITHAAESSYTVNIPAGFSTIANHLNRGGSTVAELLPAVPEGTLLYKFDAKTSGYTINAFQSGSWLRPFETLRPGEGAFIRNPGNEFAITFTGTNPSNVDFPPIYRGLNFVSLPAPSETPLPKPNPGEAIFRWQSHRQSYRTSTFDDLDNAWIPPLESFGKLGESFFYRGSVRRSAPPATTEPLSSGTLYFSTHVLEARAPDFSESNSVLGDAWRAVDARVMRADGTAPGDEFTAQLFAGAAGTAPEMLAPLLPATKFYSSGTLAGYVRPVMVTPAIPAGARATLVLRVYNGASFADSSVRGESPPITVTMGGGTLLAAVLAGLQGFSLPAVPPTSGRITYERIAGGLVLIYSGTLQSADVVTGPYSDVSGATSPTRVRFGTTATFYRVKP